MKTKKKLLLMLWYRFINWQKMFFTFFCFSEFPTPHTWKEWDWFLKMFGIIWLILLQINNSREWVKEHSHRKKISKSEKMVIFTYTLQIYHQCLNFCFGEWGMGLGESRSQVILHLVKCKITTPFKRISSIRLKK